MASQGWQQPSVTADTGAIPVEVAEYLQKWVVSIRSPACLIADRQGRLVSTWGDLSHYGLSDLRLGESTAEQAYFLEGLLPIDGGSVLCRVETTPGIFADIHLFPITEGDCILLLDASSEVAERARIEQALRHAEEQLRQSEKMEALGRLVGGVAHDFNNLLTVILGYSHILMHAPLEDKHLTAAAAIKGTAEKAAELTKHLLSFSRRRALKVDVLDLNAVISRLHPLLRRLIREDIIFTIKADPDLAFVQADAGQIEQVVLNLVSNARDAITDSGVIEVSTANVDIDEEYLIAHPTKQLRPGPHVVLSVQDDGCGMDADTMARAFEPFFTSKAAGHGTGLGLAIVYGIVYQSGGDIFLTSGVGEGTRVEILLPAVEKSPSIDAEPREENLARGSETVLLVEDEESLRQLVREILEGLGYHVLESAGPEEALALSDHHSGRIDLLMTDLIMPRMNGKELAARIMAARPDIHVLYMSGYAQELPSQRSLDIDDGVFLGKPFTPKMLADRLREAMSRPGSRRVGP